jgi:predicted flap endonuclease-1-like 5' DNA nuclease
VSFPKAGRFHLKFYHSAPTTSPCYVSIDGVQQNGVVLSEQTPGAALPQWFEYGPFDFPQGDVVLRLTPLRGSHPLIWDIGAAEVAAPALAPPAPPEPIVPTTTAPTTTAPTTTAPPVDPPTQIELPKEPAQSISGNVNAHVAVTEISGEKVTFAGTTNPFRAGDRVVVLQTAGAFIDTSDDERFGSITSDNGAGRYVWATVIGTNGQAVRLAEEVCGFDTKNGKVQLVRASSHPGDVNVTGRMDVAAWDGTAGGVIAIEAGGTLQIGAEVDASGKGFKGGSVSANSAGATARGYVYAATSLAGWKGEGIGAVSADQAAGRGAPANAGGGGNEHNSGGGGGSNGGAGGRGGFEYHSQTGDTNGIGGRSLDYADRAFLGGGGGGGQQNNAQGSAGAAGGGIVLLRARSVKGSAGGAIRANGANAANAGWDGAGGGGAGGTILIDTTSVSGGLILEALGGKGGTTGWGQGEGAGGGGGTIRTNAALPASVKTSLLGGDSGRMGGGATAGSPGIIGPLLPTQSRCGGDCGRIREDLEKKIAQHDQKCAACDQKLDAIEKKLADQERSNIDQERRLLDQDRKIAEQEKSNLGQERKLLEQDKKIGEQERNNIDQERKLLEQDKKVAEQERSNLEQEKRLFEQDRKIAELMAQAKTIDELTNKLNELAAKFNKCGACEEKLVAQAKTIDELTNKLNELAAKFEEAKATNVTPPVPPLAVQEPPPPPPPADDLEAIEGIGPKIAEVLKNAGIRTYKDLAAASVATLKKILTDAGGAKFARNDSTTWPKQAQYIVAGDKAGLKAFQDALRGGRPLP